MKKILQVTMALAALQFALSSCGESRRHIPESTGAPYEVMVVAGDGVWQSVVGDTLQAILLAPVELLNQTEPVTDVRQISPAAFKGLALKLRNLLIVNVNDTILTPSMTVEYDVYAKPQIVVTAQGPNDVALAYYLSESRKELVQVFYMAERDRMIAKFEEYASPALSEAIEAKFGFGMSIPTNYTLRAQSDNFIWISHELPIASQGIVIYDYPYTGSGDFSVDSLVAKRDSFVSRIPGPSDGSYMITSDLIPPELEFMRINGRSWAFMSGFWDVQGDYMGGPMRSYTTLDASKNRLVCIDTYVFSPKDHKRNYVRQLENIIYTVRFPGE